MTKNQQRIEILIGSILSLVGVALLWAGIELYIWLFEYVLEQPESLMEPKNYGRNIFLPKFYTDSIVIPVFVLIGGILLIARKKAGWLISVAMTIYHSLLWLIFGIMYKPKDGFEWIAFGLSVLFMLLFLVLIRRTSRNHYKPSKRAGIVIAAVLGVGLLYRFLV